MKKWKYITIVMFMGLMIGMITMGIILLIFPPEMVLEAFEKNAPKPFNIETHCQNNPNDSEKCNCQEGDYAPEWQKTIKLWEELEKQECHNTKEICDKVEKSIREGTPILRANAKYICTLATPKEEAD